MNLYSRNISEIFAAEKIDVEIIANDPGHILPFEEF
jgi:hypothetical protein